MKKLFRFLFNLLATLVGADCDWRRQSVDEEICDYSGQGKSRYGR